MNLIIKSLLVSFLLVVNTIYAQPGPGQGYGGLVEGLEGLATIFGVVVIVLVVGVVIGIPLITTYLVNKKNRETVRGNKEQQILPNSILIQKLPNSTLILVFGIISIASFCFGIIGLILGIIAIVLANKATKIYEENPEAYFGFQNVKTGKTSAIVGIVLSGISVLFGLYITSLS